MNKRLRMAAIVIAAGLLSGLMMRAFLGEYALMMFGSLGTLVFSAIELSRMFKEEEVS